MLGHDNSIIVAAARKDKCMMQGAHWNICMFQMKVSNIARHSMHVTASKLLCCLTGENSLGMQKSRHLTWTGSLQHGCANNDMSSD